MAYYLYARTYIHMYLLDENPKLHSTAYYSHIGLRAYSD
jgi:hypothetical protein